MTRVAIIAALLAPSACASVPPADPLEAIRAEAWAAPYEIRKGDWRAMKDGDCRNKARWIEQQATALGHDVEMVFSERNGEFHVAPLIDGSVVLDFDRMWPVAEYPIDPTWTQRDWLVMLNREGNLR